MIKLVTNKYEFFLTGRTIYIRANNQSMQIVNKDSAPLTPDQYARLCHSIYRRKIGTSDALYELMREFRLDSTRRILK